MKVAHLLALTLSLVLFSCCGKPIKDVAESPASLNQMRLVMQDSSKDKTVGVLPTMDESFKFMVFGTGTYSARGFLRCSGHYGGSFKDANWITIKPPKRSGVCLMQVEVKENSLDSNISGVFISELFGNPDVLPLSIDVVGKRRLGVNAIQLGEHPDGGVRTLISEDTAVKIYTSTKNGTLRSRSSCKDKSGETFLSDSFIIEDGVVTTDLYHLYRNLGGINQSCVFKFLVNPADSLKEGGTLYVHVYKKFGSWLETPLVERRGNRYCFEFTDPYVVGMKVNDKASSLNAQRVCSPLNSRYEVLGVTSSLRLFYGVYDTILNDWETIQ
jgi:hypothetical protein